MDVNVGMVIQIFKLGVVSIFSGGGLKFENNCNFIIAIPVYSNGFAVATTRGMECV